MWDRRSDSRPGLRWLRTKVGTVSMWLCCSESWRRAVGRWEGTSENWLLDRSSASSFLQGYREGEKRGKRERKKVSEEGENGSGGKRDSKKKTWRGRRTETILILQ